MSAAPVPLSRPTPGLSSDIVRLRAVVFAASSRMTLPTPPESITSSAPAIGVSEPVPTAPVEPT